MAPVSRYVLITAARNESAFIDRTIASVLSQTVRPMKWIIVSDGSTDGTDDRVRAAMAGRDWIELIRLPERDRRDFAGKAAALAVGCERTADLDYDALGNLDADVSFEPDYFAFLLGKLADDPALGLVGTPYQDPVNGPYDYRFASIDHVTGPIQLFRRECFTDIGRYRPVREGAIDRIADIAARMHGWKTRTFPEKVYQHHRHTGTAQQSLLMAKFRDGRKDYAVGTAPLWEACRTVYQMTKRPFVIGSLMMAAGYASALLRRMDRPVSEEMVAFCRREQMSRLKAFAAARVRWSGSRS